EQAQKSTKETEEEQLLVYVMSDFRRRDWDGGNLQAIEQILVDMTQREIRVGLIDVNPSNNVLVSVVEVKPDVGVVLKGEKVNISATLFNGSDQVQTVNVKLFDHLKGSQLGANQ